jgi:hypothetical protein
MSVAEALKPLGYATGQFGKNHLGDRNEFLPTVHGFDEFFGNLYHLNAEQEPENPDYPKNPRFRARFGPRGVLRCKASDRDDPTVDPAYGRVGKQIIENTGPLDTKRMETVDEEFLGAALDFIDHHHRANTPWFCYFNTTRMQVWTHLKPASQGKTGLGIYPDGMVELDGYVGQLLKKLDDLGVANNTIVVLTSDNGAEVMTWPDGGTTPFRGEKATNWEGGFRVPTVIRWPGTIQPGTIYNEMFSHYDLIPDIRRRRRRSRHRGQVSAGLADRRQDLQGAPRRPQPLAVLQGRREGSPTEGLSLLERRRRACCHTGQRVEGRLQGAGPHGLGSLGEGIHRSARPQALQPARGPLRAWGHLVSLRRMEVFLYDEWKFDRVFVLVPAQALAAQWLHSFKEFPMRQAPAAFNLDDVMAKLAPKS